MTFLFTPKQRTRAVNGELVYDYAEYSFRFERPRLESTEAGVTSLLLGTLQIEVDVAMRRILFFWGLHPYTRWKDGPAAPGKVLEGDVIVHTDTGLKTGISHAVAEVGEWATTYDSTTGWVHVHPPDWYDDKVQVEVAPGCLVGLQGEALSSVWLKPAKWVGTRHAFASQNRIKSEG